MTRHLSFFLGLTLLQGCHSVAHGMRAVTDVPITVQYMQPTVTMTLPEQPPLMTVPVPMATPTPIPCEVDIKNQEAAFLEQTLQSLRRQRALFPLSSHPLLQKAAFQRALIEECAPRAGDDSAALFTKILQDWGYKWSWAAAIVERKNKMSEDILQGWLQHPDYRNLLLSPQAMHVGVAVVTTNDEKGGYIIVLFLARPEP